MSGSKSAKSLKKTFSEVILREVSELARAPGEKLDRIARSGVPKANPKVRKALLEGRGRRAPRPR
jgi:hypothetical protein